MNAVTTEHRSVSPVSLLSTAPAGARPLLRSPRPLPTVEAQECVPRDTGAVRVTLPGLGRQLEQPSLSDSTRSTTEVTTVTPGLS